MDTCLRASRQKRSPVLIGDGVYQLELTHGHSTLFDACDLDRIVDFTWFAHLRAKNPSWYASGYVDGKFMRMHRFILGVVAGDTKQVDHINGNQGDNRRSNLRLVSNRQNNQNRRTAKGAVPFKGVTLVKCGFKAGIQIDGRREYLGTFPDAITAALAYDAAALSIFGDYAATNESLGLFI